MRNSRIRTFKMLAILAGMVLTITGFGPCGVAQTSSAKTTFGVTAAAPPSLTVTITPSVTTVEQGGSISFAVTATAPSGSTQGAVVGAIELLVTLPGTTAPSATFSTYTIVNGAVTGSYVVNSTAAVGTYTVEAVYCSSMQVKANYATSPDCK